MTIATEDRQTEQDERALAELDARAKRIMERIAASMPQPPRFRYFTGKNGHIYSWTTEVADQGKYWVQEYKPDGKGNHHEVRRMGFKLRRLAKARALAWYQGASK